MNPATRRRTENNFFPFSFFLDPGYRHLSRRIDYAKIIFFNNQRIDSTGAHLQRGSRSVATSIDDNEPNEEISFLWEREGGREIRFGFEKARGRSKVAREKKGEGGESSTLVSRHCAPLNCSHCDPRVLQIPIRALRTGINPFP